MKLAAHLSHYAFYLLMIGMPLIGWGMLSAAAYPVGAVPGRDPRRRSCRRAPACMRCCGARMFYLAFAFFALILLHVAAALFHALVRRDGVFEAMASGPARDGAAPSERRVV